MHPAMHVSSRNIHRIATYIILYKLAKIYQIWPSLVYHKQKKSYDIYNSYVQISISCRDINFENNKHLRIMLAF